MLKKIFTSIICATTLYSSQYYKSDFLDRYLNKETKSYSTQLGINESEYTSLCNNIVKINTFGFYTYMLLPKYFLNFKDIEKHDYFQKIAMLDKIIATSKKRMNDKIGNAYYSPLVTNFKDIEKHDYFQKIAMLDKIIATSKKRMNDKIGNAYYSPLVTNFKDIEKHDYFQKIAMLDKIIATSKKRMNDKIGNAYYSPLVTNFKDIEKHDYFQKIAMLDKIIATSKKRMNDKNFSKFGNADLNVYYSSLATKNILEIILDENFMKITGGLDISFFKEDFDIIEYGKGVEEAQNIKGLV